MTRKDYTKIANALKIARGRCTTGPEQVAIDRVATELGVVFQLDNPNYDHGKFFAATN